MTDAPNPYKILQVDPEAEDEVIQAAYRRLARKYHPDVAPGPEAAARMAAINAAWTVLADPARRAELDRGRSPEEPTATPGSRPSDAQPATGSGRGRASSTARPDAARAPGARGPSEDPSPPSPEFVSSDWTSGRSSTGGGYDPSRMRAPDGFGAAGPPPGEATGSVLNFGRFAGWSLGEIARTDLDYIEWLDRTPIGRPYREEIDAILRRAGRRASAATEARSRHGLFRRR
jgi:curved DNA-binding protein CbpA